MITFKDIVIAILLALVISVGYFAWLDYGCELNGVMTWHGKKCVDEIGE